MSDIATGAVVRISGISGPAMKVVSTHRGQAPSAVSATDAATYCECVWFDATAKVYREKFPSTVLEPVPPEQLQAANNLNAIMSDPTLMAMMDTILKKRSS